TVTAAGQRFAVGETATSSSTFNMSGGAINVVSDWAIMGRYGSCIGTLSGTGTITAGANFVTAEMATANTTFTQSGGAINAAIMFISRFGVSTFNQSAGTINLTSYSSVAKEVGSTGTWNMSGGTYTNTVDCNIGDYGNGTFDQTGGTV